MTHKSKVRSYLIQEPKARERVNKNRAIANMVIKDYGWLMRALGENKTNKESISNLVGDILSLDRAWRKLLEDEPELRGGDYGDKERLEQEKMVELGYEVGINKKLNI